MPTRTRPWRPTGHIAHRCYDGRAQPAARGACITLAHVCRAHTHLWKPGRGSDGGEMPESAQLARQELAWRRQPCLVRGFASIVSWRSTCSRSHLKKLFSVVAMWSQVAPTPNEEGQEACAPWRRLCVAHLVRPHGAVPYRAWRRAWRRLGARRAAPPTELQSLPGTSAWPDGCARHRRVTVGGAKIKEYPVLHIRPVARRAPPDAAANPSASPPASPTSSTPRAPSNTASPSACTASKDAVAWPASAPAGLCAPGCLYACGFCGLGRCGAHGPRARPGVQHFEASSVLRSGASTNLGWRLLHQAQVALTARPGTVRRRSSTNFPQLVCIYSRCSTADRSLRCDLCYDKREPLPKTRSSTS